MLCQAEMWTPDSIFKLCSKCVKGGRVVGANHVSTFYALSPKKSTLLLTLRFATRANALSHTRRCHEVRRPSAITKSEPEVTRGQTEAPFSNKNKIHAAHCFQTGNTIHLVKTVIRLIAVKRSSL